MRNRFWSIFAGATLALLLGSTAPAEAQTLLSAGKPATASSFYDVGSETFPASNVTDGDFDDTGTDFNWSFWLSSEATGFVTVDLQSSFSITKLRLQNTHNRGHNDRGSNQYNLLVSSDGTSFTPVVSDSFGTWPALPIVEHNIAPVTARYVRFQALTRYGDSVGLNELEVYGESGSAVPEPGSGVLLVAGLAALGLLRNRRKPNQ